MKKELCLRLTSSALSTEREGRKSGPSENQRLTSCPIKLGHLALALNQRQMEKEKKKEKGRKSNPENRQRQFLYLLSPQQGEWKLPGMFVAPELEFVAAPRKRSEVPD